MISEDHMWHIIVQRTYIQTYCIQICKNKWITRVNISGFISACLSNTMFGLVFRLGKIAHHQTSLSEQGYWLTDDPVVNINQMSTQKGSFWWNFWMHGLSGDPEIEHEYNNKEAKPQGNSMTHGRMPSQIQSPELFLKSNYLLSMGNFPESHYFLLVNIIEHCN